MRSDSLQFACVQPPTSLPVRLTIENFQAGHLGIHLATTLEGNTTGLSDRTERIDRMVVMVIRTDRQTGQPGQTGQTSQKGLRGQTYLILKQDFPGHLCRAAFAILAVSNLISSAGQDSER